MKKILAMLLAIVVIFGSIGMTNNNVYASGNIIIGGVDLGYSDGSYFSTTGSACSCHGRGTCGKAKDCTCVVVSGCCQCYGWSMWIENKLFGYNEISSPSNFSTVISGYSGCTGSGLYNKFNGSVGSGAHIRTMDSVKGYAHSVSVISYDANGINITDCNHSGKCQIDVRYYTWDSFAAFVNGYGGISFVSTCKNAIIPTPGYDKPVVNSWRFEYFNNGVRPVIEIDNPSSISSVTFYLRFGTTAEWKSCTGKYNLDKAWYCEAAYDELSGTGDVVCHVYVYGKDGSQQSFVIEKPRVESTRYEYFNNGIRPVVEMDNPSSISSVTFYLRFGATAEWKSYSGKYNLDKAWYCEAAYDELNGAGDLTCEVYVDGKDGSHEYVQISEKPDITNIEETRYEYFDNGIRPVVTIANHSKVSNVTFYLRYGTTAEWKSYSGKYNLDKAWYCEAAYDELNGTGVLVCDVYVDLTDGTHQYVSGFPNSICNHIYDDGVITTEPTCTKTGIKTYTCSACNNTKTESIVASGHTIVTDKAVTATCTTSGLTEGSHCSVCGTVIKSQEYIAAGGHRWNDGEVIKEATGNSTGIKKYTCKVCKTTKEEEIPATGEHIYNSKITKNATCTEDGILTYYCIEDDCTASYTQIIPATGHTTVNDKAVEPTCNSEGKTAGMHCSVCGTVITAQIAIPATGNHSWDDGIITKQATELSEGVKSYTCIICGETKTEGIPKLNHTHSLGAKHDAVAATCSTKGSVEYYDCTGCNSKLDKDGKVITNFTTAIDTSNHTGPTELKNVKEETCGTDGYTGDTYCKKCGGKISDGTTIPATEQHKEKETIIKATTIDDGSIIYECTSCGKTTKTIIAYPKRYILSNTKYVYDGKVKKPSLKIYDSTGKLISSSEYTITYAFGRKNVGNYTYKVRFKGDYYSGIKTVSFEIVPKRANVKKVSVGKKYIKVYVSSKVISIGGTDYQIAYRVLGTRKWKYTTTTSTSKMIYKLNKGKKYQVKIRAYKKVGSTIHYGDWSSTKTSAKVR